MQTQDPIIHILLVTFGVIGVICLFLVSYRVGSSLRLREEEKNEQIENRRKDRYNPIFEEWLANWKMPEDVKSFTGTLQPPSTWPSKLILRSNANQDYPFYLRDFRKTTDFCPKFGEEVTIKYRDNNPDEGHASELWWAGYPSSPVQGDINISGEVD